MYLVIHTYIHFQQQQFDALTKMKMLSIKMGKKSCRNHPYLLCRSAFLIRAISYLTITM